MSMKKGKIVKEKFSSQATGSLFDYYELKIKR